MLKRYTKLLAACFTMAALLLGIQPSALSQDYKLNVLAKEGDVLADYSMVEAIYPETLAINDIGRVAFFGVTDFNELALFTQDAVLVRNNDTLQDTSIVEIRDIRALDFNNAGTLAFHGFTSLSEAAVFTQYGVAVKEGDPVQDGDGSTIENISAWSIAIDEAGKVAFHGATEVGVDAVFIQDSAVVEAYQTLPDGSTVGHAFSESLAMNDTGLVAFHGSTTEVKYAFFTQEGVVVIEGQSLPDGSTFGTFGPLGVDINDAGQVAFFGSTEEVHNAAFILDNLIAVEGQTLPDDTFIDHLFSDGIALNNAGQVALFGNNKAGEDIVFTQDGVVAVEGNALSDGSTIRDIKFHINSIGINNYGQIAFLVRGDDDLDRVVRADPFTPVEIVEEIITFYDEGLADDTLFGINPGGHDGAIRERWFGRALDTIQKLIIAEDYTEACVELSELMLRVDGERSPFDWIGGAATPDLHEMMLALSNELGC